MPRDNISGDKPRSTPYSRRDAIRRSPRKIDPEARHLLMALEEAFAAEPHCVQFVRRSVEQNAHRLIDDYNAHDGILMFDPPWLLDASRAVVRALRETKSRVIPEDDDNPHAHASDGPADEESYRRGFQQGAYYALDLPGVTAANRKVVAKWMHAVYRWRFLTSHKKRLRPPDGMRQDRGFLSWWMK